MTKLKLKEKGYHAKRVRRDERKKVIAAKHTMLYSTKLKGN